MELDSLKQQILSGEDSQHQFKVDIHNADALAAEIVAMANSEGGTLFIGVNDDGSMTGLTSDDVARVNQLISNVASQHIRSPLAVRTENVRLDNGRIVIVLSVPKGIEKPYFDKNGIIWLKAGSDKRRIHSREELRRLFQSVDVIHADEVPTRAGVDQLDRLRFRDFLSKSYSMAMPDQEGELLRLLQNMNLACEDGHLNLAGVLLFAEQPEWIKPEFIVKAIAYPGNRIDVADYLDSEDFSGSMRKIFDDSMAFISRNLRKVQHGQSINTLGQPEIPRIVFEELLVNALVHRDYFICATIRITVFEDRIEIISPGHLPNHLTVEKIRSGNSNLRNPILASFVAKGLLPYRGLGSGIRRSLEAWQSIDFEDDRDGCTFKVTVWRENVQNRSTGASINGDNSIKVQSDAPINEPITEIQSNILLLIRQQSGVSYDELATELNKDRSTIMRNIQKLKDMGIIERTGSRKRGCWIIHE